MSTDPALPLLIGLLAHRVELISRAECLAALQAWSDQPSKTLDAILLEQGALSTKEREALLPLIKQHIADHEGDVMRSIASLSGLGSLADDLGELEGFEATLSAVGQYQRSDSNDSTHLRLDPQHGGIAVGRHSSEGFRFRIIRPHAKGGLGQVSLARDNEINRNVAIKEIRARYARDPASQQRFLLEAEITGGLEHPGIVPVYGLGRYDDGRPFYAMRFIQGDSLKDAVQLFYQEFNSDDGQVLTSSVYGQVAFRKLLGRFVDVCQAIQYAHSRGVLHRDLKPGNIMLGKYGETLVVDWGLAKTQQQDQGDSLAPSNEEQLRPSSASGSSDTKMGTPIGTPAFMPPEQAAGRLDEIGPASDVYSLGATLYFVLVGTAPFEEVDSNDLLETVRTGRFRLPRSIRPEIPPALEAICLKAMAVNPADRYQTPEQLADDVERFAADEPVTAYAESLPVRIRRWMRKHPQVAASLAATVLVGFISTLIVSAVVAGKNQQLAKVNADLEASNLAEITARKEAVQQRQEAIGARRLAESHATEAMQQSQLALSTLTSVISDVQSGLEDLPAGSQIKRQLLRTSLEKLEAVAVPYVGQVRVDLATVEALCEMGTMIRRFGTDNVGDSQGAATEEQQSALELATRFYQRAKEIADRLVAEDETGIIMQEQLRRCLQLLGEVALEAGDIEQGVQHLRESLEIQQRLASAHPGDWVPVRNVATAAAQLGNRLMKMDELDEAEQLLLTAEEILSSLSLQHPQIDQLRDDLGSLTDYLSELYERQGRFADLEETVKDGLAIREELAAKSPDSIKAKRSLYIAHQNLGSYYFGKNDFPAALDSFNAFYELVQELADNSPEDNTIQRELGVALSFVGNTHSKMENYADALKVYEQALDLAKKQLQRDDKRAENHRDLAVSHYKVGETLIQQGQYSEGVKYLHQSVDVLQKMIAQNMNSVQVQMELQQLQEFTQQMERRATALGDWDELLATGGDELAAHLEFRAIQFTAEGRFQEAAQAAATLIDRGETDPTRLYNSACVFALCAASFPENAADQKEQREKWIESALSALEASVENGWDDFEHLKQDTDLTILRDQPRYKALLENPQP